MKTFLIACGGTGGHLSPGIALAEELVARGSRCTLLISTKQIDSTLCRKYPHLDFRRTPGTGFSLSPLRLARFVGAQARALAFARAQVRATRPDCVIGFGGFTSAALAFAARSAGIPVVLHEANRVPGRAIRFAGGLARRVYLPPGVVASGLSPAVVRACGLPVRREFVRVPRARARLALGLEPDRRTLVVLGGSQGAGALNDWLDSALPSLAREGVQACCLAGPGKREAGVVEHPGPDGRPVRARFLPFSDDMPVLLSAADLAVSRAGAGTIAELVRLHLPGLLVPFPGAADDHQTHNARHFEHQGGGFTIDQSFVANLTREVVEVIFNDRLLARFAHDLQRMDRDDAATFIADDLERLLRTAAGRVATKGVVLA